MFATHANTENVDLTVDSGDERVRLEVNSSEWITRVYMTTDEARDLAVKLNAAIADIASKQKNGER